MHSGLSAQNQADVDVPASCIGVRANLMCSVDQALGQLPVKAWQADLQLDLEAKPARDLADTDVGGNRGVGRQRLLLLASDELQGANEARRIPGRKQLFRVRCVASLTAQLARSAQLDVKVAVRRNGSPIAPSGGRNGCYVERLNGLHDFLLSVMEFILRAN